MADPVSLTGISMASGLAQGAFGALGASQSGASKSAMYQYQAGIAQMNAKIAKQNAEYALTSGEKEANISGMKSRALMGKIKTAQAASGVDVNTGTNVELQDSATQIARMDQKQIRENAGRKSFDYRVQKANAEAQAGVYMQNASMAEDEGNIGAITSILGSVSSVAGKWSQAKTAGIF